MVAASILVLFALGLTSAVVLGAASKALYVEEDPRIALVENCLPGANCGGCGYPGCSAAAAAIVKGEVGPEVCVAGGPEIAESIAAIVGAEVAYKEPRMAVNICAGGTRARLLFDYEGLHDCRAEALLYGGEKVCGIGCIGMGSCVKACKFGALRLSKEHLPVVNTDLCVSCGRCAEVCPTGAIRIAGMTSELLHYNQLNDCLAPCMQKCPAQVDVRGFIQQIKRGDLAGAVQTIKMRNPLPLTVGRVCPAPCETICRRNIVDEGVAIHTLQRFVADWEMSTGSRVRLNCNPKSGHRVAIIGGGPAGLSCAYFLRRIGHEPVIFEKRETLGGMMRGVIPEYRLPGKSVEWEIQSIVSLGVGVKTGREFGKDISLESLEKDGFEAVFMATGAWKVPLLGIENDTAQGVVDSVAFLKGVGSTYTNLGCRKIVVIGDTNSAMDVARSAARLGAKVSVLVGCAQRKMSANKNEVKRAIEIDADLLFLTEPTRILVSEGSVSGVEYQQLAYDDPEKAKGKPKPVENTVAVLEADMVVAALERQVDTAPLTDAQGEALFEMDKKTGGIKTDPISMQTSRANVFAGGEVHTGRSIVIQAVADGRLAARSIHYFLTEGAVPPLENGQLRVIPETILKGMHVTYNIPRINVPEIPVEDRRFSFTEEVKGFVGYPQARKESSRCLRCGLTCYDAGAGAEYAEDAEVHKFSELGKE